MYIICIYVHISIVLRHGYFIVGTFSETAENYVHQNVVDSGIEDLPHSYVMSGIWIPYLVYVQLLRRSFVSNITFAISAYCQVPHLHLGGVRQ